MNISDLPNINFCETNATDIQQDVINVFEGITKRTLSPGNPERLFLESLATIIIQQRIAIDYAAKQDLLAHANDSFLDHIGAFTDTERLKESSSISIAKFSMDTALDFVVSIPAGSRITPDGELFFNTTEYAEILTGKTEIEVSIICEKSGSIGNGYVAGQINQMVDVLPYITSVANIDTTIGGSDVEKDDSYRERIHLSTGKYSIAGPTDAYIFWAKTAHQDIIDVSVFRSAPLDDLSETQINSILEILNLDSSGMDISEKKIKISYFLSSAQVNICALLENGTIPGQSIIDSIKEILNDKNRRPLTDNLNITAPGVINYNIDLTYYISDTNSPAISTIKSKVEAAVDNFILWQKTKIGRDINPDELTKLIINAGAKRVEIVEPVFTILNKSQIAINQNSIFNYGGLENE